MPRPGSQGDHRETPGQRCRQQLLPTPVESDGSAASNRAGTCSAVTCTPVDPTPASRDKAPSASDRISAHRREASVSRPSANTSRRWSPVQAHLPFAARYDRKPFAGCRGTTQDVLDSLGPYPASRQARTSGDFADQRSRSSGNFTEHDIHRPRLRGAIRLGHTPIVVDNGRDEDGPPRAIRGMRIRTCLMAGANVARFLSYRSGWARGRITHAPDTGSDSVVQPDADISMA
ncbi:hypothetical protein SAMN05421748_1573 [Paractinoplanes atraurantiacus]|uniref:Uncharacterized protein n=1 Tax=Paractinoplanes atraurantiacus TaxID=1036182 RepID=A0A285KVD8_9ACTN|nr:hypothetical protein SAMN05421748_1573 [Actinoplanes atraurantiacus]